MVGCCVGVLLFISFARDVGHGECLFPGGVGDVHGTQLRVQRRKRVLGDLGHTNGISWMSTKFGSQQKQSPEGYRRMEDQHLYIEIQPYGRTPLPRGRRGLSRCPAYVLNRYSRIPVAQP